MLNNVKDFGATGNGVDDDRVAIQAAIDDAVAGGKGGVFFPSGVYSVGRATVPGGRWSLDLNRVRDFLIAGEGPSSVVRLADSATATGDWHVFILRKGCQRVTFTDLVVDGNRQGLAAPDEQSHGVEVEAGTEDLLIDRCILRHCFGDGVRVLGQGGAEPLPVRRVRISNCLFQANKRSGLGMQRAVEQIVVSQCQFEGTVADSEIDFEPTGSVAPTDILIQGCIIRHSNPAVAVSLSGISGTEPMVRCKFTDNLVLGGEVFCTDVTHLTVQNNTIVVPDTDGRNRVPLQVQRGGEGLLVSGNLIIQGSAATEAAVSISEVNGRQVSRALLSGNLCMVRAGNGIACLSSDDVAIQGNMIVATGAGKAGIVVRSESSPVSGISVRDNDISIRDQGVWAAGIRIAATDAHGVGDLSVIANSIRGASVGVAFDGKHYLRTPVCALNRTDAGVTTPISGLGRLPEGALVVGGAASGDSTAADTGCGRFLIGLGDPNGKVSGQIGDIFQRLDGRPGNCLYVKESGGGSQVGWSAK